MAYGFRICKKTTDSEDYKRLKHFTSSPKSIAVQYATDWLKMHDSSLYFAVIISIDSSMNMRAIGKIDLEKQGV